MEFKGTKSKWILETRTTRPETYWIIALDKGQILPICSILRDNSRANAQLISKAPEMLEMLKDIVDTLQSGETPHLYKIDELIKEATTI